MTVLTEARPIRCRRAAFVNRIFTQQLCQTNKIVSNKIMLKAIPRRRVQYDSLNPCMMLHHSGLRGGDDEAIGAQDLAPEVAEVWGAAPHGTVDPSQVSQRERFDYKACLPASCTRARSEHDQACRRGSACDRRPEWERRGWSHRRVQLLNRPQACGAGVPPGDGSGRFGAMASGPRRPLACAGPASRHRRNNGPQWGVGRGASAERVGLLSHDLRREPRFLRSVGRRACRPSHLGAKRCGKGGQRGCF